MKVKFSGVEESLSIKGSLNASGNQKKGWFLLTQSERELQKLPELSCPMLSEHFPIRHIRMRKKRSITADFNPVKIA
jgi:hypothetical protein